MFDSSTLSNQIQRRTFLNSAGVSLGSAALSALMAREGRAANSSDEHRPLPHHRARVKRVIFLYMSGGPSHLETFDEKPVLAKMHGQAMPESFTKGQPIAQLQGQKLTCQGPLIGFRKLGQSGQVISDFLPWHGKMADDICIIRSMVTEQINHDPAHTFMNTGTAINGRPSMGSWVTYGLGTENEDLPGFVVLISSGVQPNGGKNSFGSGFLPSVYQGVQCRSKGDPVLYVSDPEGMDRGMRRLTLDALRDLNELQAREMGHPETQTRIAQYELAFRMQVSVPEVMDISREPPHVLEAYGARPGEASLANNCLLARRLIEQGVRFVQLFDWGWDFHGTGPQEDIRDGLTKKCASMDRPVAALIKDLKQRGLLDETLIVWGGEFGRTPFREGRTAGGSILGRDHFPDCYTMFLAGGGVKGGMMHGESDELGFSVARDGVHVHDLQATILHLLGFNHEKLTYRFQGRDYRLTDVHGKVVREVLL